MEKLTEMHCVGCRRDAPTVTDEELAELKPQVVEWELEKLEASIATTS